ncbi:hypothetical protein LBMAG15_03700 [Actinomycetes bacterium]|nr:hypothetical protein LBMAG15_03700 [Actinomycetes bacterium]
MVAVLALHSAMFCVSIKVELSRSINLDGGSEMSEREIVAPVSSAPGGMGGALNPSSINTPQVP